jgi:uncharacterized membrane protein
MKIYQKNILGMDITTDKLLLAIAVLLVIGLILVLGTNSLNTTLSAHLTQNPASLSANDSSILQVTLTNPVNTPINNLTITAQTPGSTQLSVYPKKQTISTLGPQERREMEFLVVPIDTTNNPFLPGTYRIDLQTTIEGKSYTNSVFLTVEK